MLLAGDDFHQGFNAFDFGGGDHAVPEVENEARLGAGLVQHALRFDASDRWSGGQYRGIEIPLHGGAVTQ